MEEKEKLRPQDVYNSHSGKIYIFYSCCKIHITNFTIVLLLQVSVYRQHLCKSSIMPGNSRLSKMKTGFPAR